MIKLTARYAQDAESAEEFYFCFPVRGRKTKNTDLFEKKKHIIIECHFFP
jgi:hypothetical protein